MNYLRTALLLAGLTALFMGVGYLVGGPGGATIALVVAAGMNMMAYWNADQLVLTMHGAQEVDERTAHDLFRLVRDLADRAGLPMPRVYLMDNPQPNACDRAQSRTRGRRGNNRPALNVGSQRDRGRHCA